jgi:hypothetical protein
VPFGDSAAIGAEIAALLTNDARRKDLCAVAYAHSRSMTWERVAERYVAMFEKAIGHRDLSIVQERDEIKAEPTGRLPPRMRLGHFMSMCDDTGLLQHAVHCVPDRSHGYCIDDNARALLLACTLNRLGEKRLGETLTTTFAAFIQDAWNPAARRFRNFMSFERRWLEDTGSEDSHGRTLWALGECAGSDTNLSRRHWAAALFVEAAQSAEAFQSPRAWAFTLLGLDAYRGSHARDSRALELQHLLAARLLSIMAAVETQDWVWFEHGLSYDNARLSQALIATGASVHEPHYAGAGLRSLRWLMKLQTAGNGYFRPVGSQTFGDLRRQPRPFDQQPLEAAASIAACLAAWRADGDPAWKAHAARAFDWFLGSNDLETPLVDTDTGSCCDGLHPDRVNQNRGGESVLSYLLGLAEMRSLARVPGIQATPATLRALRARVH